MTLSIPKGFNIGSLYITFYGVISAFCYLIGVIIAIKNAKKRGFSTEDIITLACYVIPLCIVGARLYYVLFSLDSYTSFWDIFKIWNGGLAFYGGLIGGTIGVVLFCVIHKKNFFALADIIVPGLIFGQALGRWGNFFNQEAFGYAVTDPAWQWFPFAVYIDGSGWHLATFFYESLWNFVGFVVLETLLYRVNFKQNGVVAGFYLIIYGTGRVWIEGLRTDSLYLGSMRVSQILSIVFIIAGICFVSYCFIKSYLQKRKESFNIIMRVLKKDLK